MTPTERLEVELRNARTRADREGSDRHSNPGRARRDLMNQAAGSAEVRRLEMQLEVADLLDVQGIPWTLMSVTIHLQLPDGTTFLAAKGEKLLEQIDLFHANKGAALGSRLHEKLIIHDLDVTLTRDMAWVRKRMEGTSAPKFRADLLAAAGLVDDNGLTPLGESTGFFAQDHGVYGIFQRATPLGIAWIYSCYLRGNVPLTKAAQKIGPLPDIELAEISRTAGTPDELLPPHFAKLADW